MPEEKFLSSSQGVQSVKSILEDFARVFFFRTSPLKVGFFRRSLMTASFTCCCVIVTFKLSVVWYFSLQPTLQTLLSCWWRKKFGALFIVCAGTELWCFTHHFFSGANPTDPKGDLQYGGKNPAQNIFNTKSSPLSSRGCLIDKWDCMFLYMHGGIGFRAGP